MIFYSSSLQIMLGKIANIHSNETDHKTTLPTHTHINCGQFLTINYHLLTMYMTIKLIQKQMKCLISLKEIELMIKMLNY